jgi:glutamate-1-semialdehyde 2,1-aminomutase
MTQPTSRSGRLFEEAQRLLPGGVDSPVRAFRGVGGVPRFISQGAGAWLTDVDNNRYIDYVLSWGPLILGHAHPEVVEAIVEQARRGTTFGAPTEAESLLASSILAALPALEMVRFVSSGTEAAMSAIRLARAYTARPKIVKFAGCYHGHADALLVQAGSGVATLGLPDSPGVTASATGDTLTAPYNDLAAVRELFQTYPERIAAILVEPVAGNMGLVLPLSGFLAGLRQIATEYGALLIFDEVMTGFRVAFGGAQTRYDIVPDLTCLGKVIGGGLPAAAYGGRSEIMSMVAPAGPVYQAGTLSGNPLAMAAGMATLRLIQEPGFFAALERSTEKLTEGMAAAAAAAGVSLQVASAGSMWGFFFNDAPVTDYSGARRSDTARYARFFHAMLERGVYLAPSQFESAFVSSCHDESTIAQTLAAAAEALAAVAEPGA